MTDDTSNNAEQILTIVSSITEQLSNKLAELEQSEIAISIAAKDNDAQGVQEHLCKFLRTFSADADTSSGCDVRKSAESLVDFLTLDAKINLFADIVKDSARRAAARAKAKEIKSNA